MTKPAKTFDYLLHLGANKEIFIRANKLRREMTEAERMLWKALRNGKLQGFKFRRQHPINMFIADFYCHQANLVIEVDGEIHNLAQIAAHDEGRTFELEQLGIIVKRFTNEQVANELDKVLCEIEAFLCTSPPAPLLKERGGASN